MYSFFLLCFFFFFSHLASLPCHYQASLQRAHPGRRQEGKATVVADCGCYNGTTGRTCRYSDIRKPNGVAGQADDCAHERPLTCSRDICRCKGLWGGEGTEAEGWI